MPTNSNLLTNRSGVFTVGFGVALIVASVAGLIIGVSILKKPISRVSNAAACSCTAPPDTHGWTDNFCFHPPGTTDCPMTHPGGYCDPNGDGSYEDGNWIQGYNEYYAQCGSPTQTPAVSTTPSVSTAPSVPSECKVLQQTGDPTTKYDLVLLPVFYTDEASYTADAQETIAAINASNLGALNNKINIIASTSLTESFSMNKCTSGGRAHPCWDLDRAKEAQRKCNGDGYMILLYVTKPTEVKTQEDYDRYIQEIASWGNIGGMSVDLKEGHVVLLRSSLEAGIHELGHSIAGASDEYSFGIPYDGSRSELLNCSSAPSNSESEACPKWSSQFPGVGCYSICGYTDWYRPAQNSIMLSPYSSTIFNPPTLFLWEEALKNFQ